MGVDSVLNPGAIWWGYNKKCYLYLILGLILRDTLITLLGYNIWLLCLMPQLPK